MKIALSMLTVSETLKRQLLRDRHGRRQICCDRCQPSMHLKRFWSETNFVRRCVSVRSTRQTLVTKSDIRRPCSDYFLPSTTVVTAFNQIRRELIQKCRSKEKINCYSIIANFIVTENLVVVDLINCRDGLHFKRRFPCRKGNGDGADRHWGFRRQIFADFVRSVVGRPFIVVDAGVETAHDGLVL